MLEPKNNLTRSIRLIIYIQKILNELIEFLNNAKPAGIDLKPHPTIQILG